MWLELRHVSILLGCSNIFFEMIVFTWYKIKKSYKVEMNARSHEKLMRVEIYFRNQKNYDSLQNA